MQVVGRAVERVDHPLEVVLAVHAAFFCEYRVTRVGPANDVDDGLLGVSIDFADIVVHLLLGNGQCVEAVERAHDDATGLSCGAYRNSYRGVHGVLETVRSGRLRGKFMRRYRVKDLSGDEHCRFDLNDAVARVGSLSADTRPDPGQPPQSQQDTGIAGPRKGEHRPAGRFC